MTNGLNYKDVKRLTDLLVKSNTEQLIAIKRVINDEIEERVQKELEDVQ